MNLANFISYIFVILIKPTANHKEKRNFKFLLSK